MSYNTVDQSTGDLEQIAGSTLTAIYADSPLGVILPFGGTTAPTGFLLCDGSAVSRTTYADLFAVIGTKFGTGDGSTTFNLPSHEFGANLYPNVEAKYIIKAVQTALPSDIQTQLNAKQNITDNSLETTSKTVPGAINEVNTNDKKKIKIVDNYPNSFVNLTNFPTDGYTPTKDCLALLTARVPENTFINFFIDGTTCIGTVQNGDTTTSTNIFAVTIAIKKNQKFTAVPGGSGAANVLYDSLLIMAFTD